MNDVPLREHVEAQFLAKDRYFEARLDAMRVALDKAEMALNLRLESMNEFRATLRDQTATFADRDQVDKRLGVLEKQQAQAEGRLQIVAPGWALVMSLIVGLTLKFVV